MNSLKKTLSLALVFVMVFGLMLTASAADFSDAEDVQYTEAVDVMTGIGAINGFPDGTFNPDGLVTRAQAAKMIAYATLGSSVADNLVATGKIFKDVPTTHWGAPFVEFLYSRGIIAGKSADRFDPNGNVTTYELAKMILASAGYGKNGEYVGASWLINVAIDATDLKVLAGLKDTNYADAATREEAALMIFNGISKVNVVVYSKDTNSYSAAMDSLSNPYTIGKQKFGLAKTVDEVINGVAGYTWKTNTGKAVSNFIVTDVVLGTSTNGTAKADLIDSTKDAYIAKLATGYKVFYNGTEKTGADIATAEARIAVKGVVVNFLNPNAAGEAQKVTIIDKAVVRLGSNPVVANGKVTIADIAGLTDIEVKYVPGYDALKEDDVVLWYKDGLNVWNIEKADAVTGTVTAIAGSKYYVDGVAYEKSALAGTDAANPELGNKDATYHLDDNGTIVFVTGPTAPQITDKYALVLAYKYTAADSWTGTAAKSEAKLLLADGTEVLWNLATDSGKAKDDALATGRLLKYKANANNVITEAAMVDLTTLSAALTVTNKAATTTLEGATKYVSSSTVFFFYANAASYGVVTGYTNVPTTTSAINDKVSVVQANNVLQVVLMPEALGGLTSSAVYAYVTDATPIQTLENDVVVYSYKAFVNGEATTLKSGGTKDTGGTNDIAVGLYKVQETSGRYSFAKETPVAAATVTIVEPTYFVTDTLYSITPATQVYKATKVAGTVINLEKASMELVTGKTLKAEVVKADTTAVLVIFWYE